MKVTFNWLKEFVEFTGAPEELAKLLTMAGLEVESQAMLRMGQVAATLGAGNRMKLPKSIPPPATEEPGKSSRKPRFFGHFSHLSASPGRADTWAATFARILFAKPTERYLARRPN